MSLSLADSSASFADEKVVGVAWSHVSSKRAQQKSQSSVDKQTAKFHTRLLGTFSRHVVLYQVRFSRVYMWDCYTHGVALMYFFCVKMTKLGRMGLLKSWSISPSATAFSSACVGDHSNGFVKFDPILCSVCPCIAGCVGATFRSAHTCICLLYILKHPAFKSSTCVCTC